MKRTPKNYVWTKSDKDHDSRKKKSTPPPFKKKKKNPTKAHTHIITIELVLNNCHISGKLKQI